MAYIEYQLPQKEYNFEKLIAETGWQAIMRGDDVFVYIPDDTSQIELDSIIADANKHDPTLTKLQQANAILDSLRIRNDILFELILIANEFEQPYRQAVYDGSIDRDTLYADYRAIYDALDNADKIAIQRITKAFINPLMPYNEPANPNNVTAEYKAAFNDAISMFVDKVLIRAALTI